MQGAIFNEIKEVYRSRPLIRSVCQLIDQKFNDSLQCSSHSVQKQFISVLDPLHCSILKFSLQSIEITISDPKPLKEI